MTLKRSRRFSFPSPKLVFFKATLPYHIFILIHAILHASHGITLSEKLQFHRGQLSILILLSAAQSIALASSSYGELNEAASISHQQATYNPLMWEPVKVRFIPCYKYQSPFGHMVLVQCRIAYPLVTNTRKIIWGDAKLELAYESIWCKIRIIEGSELPLEKDSHASQILFKVSASSRLFKRDLRTSAVSPSNL